MTSSKSETVFTILILILILFSSFFLRNRGTSNIPAGQLTVPDGYFYYWQAQLISEHGKLPERDMHRWLPLGRDNGQTLNLYGYALAYTHKLLAHVFPNVSLYQVTFYASVVCFCAGLATLYLFLYHTFGLLFSSSVGVLLATLPGTIERSTTGLGDRDAWCLMLGIFAITTYLTSLQTRSPRGRLLWTLISGFTVFLGGISWEGFGVFLSIILFVELWRYLSSETEKHFGYYCLWMLTFVPTLYLASPAYRNGYGFSKYLFAFMLAPPLVLLGMRILRYLIFTKAPWADILKPHARIFTLGLTLMSLAIALDYVFIQRNTFADTTIPLSQNMLMKTVAELGNPFLRYWMFRYGSVFILGALATVMGAIRFWKIDGLLLVMPLILFTLTTFYRSQLDKFWGETTGNILFGISILTCLIGFIILAWQRQYTPENEQTYIAFMLWFLFWIALSGCKTL